MSHHRKALAAAVALNAAICVGETIAGVYAGSLTLIMDAIHNVSDELALLFLLLALLVPKAPSKNLVRSANFMNSAGLLAVSALIAWQAIERAMDPRPVLGVFPTVFGVAAALGNWGVARLLREPSRHSVAIRLSYLHNLGDVYVSLVPVAVGLLVMLTGYALLDPAIASMLAIWFMATTLRDVLGSRHELIWPEGLTCNHPSNAGTP